MIAHIDSRCASSNPISRINKTKTSQKIHSCDHQVPPDVMLNADKLKEYQEYIDRPHKSWKSATKEFARIKKKNAESKIALRNADKHSNLHYLQHSNLHYSQHSNSLLVQSLRTSVISTRCISRKTSLKPLLLQESPTPNRSGDMASVDHSLILNTSASISNISHRSNANPSVIANNSLKSSIISRPSKHCFAHSSKFKTKDKTPQKSKFEFLISGNKVK